MKWKVSINKFIFISLCTISLPAFATAGHYYIGGSLSSTYGSIDNTNPQISYVSGVRIYDNYPINSRSVSTLGMSLNGGYEFAGDHWRPAIALGIGVYNTPVGYDFNGTVIETVTGDAPFTAYNFTYNMINTRVMAEAQFSWLVGRVSPYINIGFGPSWNRANGYTETPLSNAGFVALPPFQSKESLNIAYQVGLGVSTAFNYTNPSSEFKPERISIGYRYVYLGQTSFDTRGIDYPYSLNTGLLTSNDVYISYTHLI